MSKELKYTLIISVSYLVFGILWIFFSDKALAAMVTSTEQFHRISSIKGILYVCVTAVLIFGLVLSYYKKYVTYQRKYFEKHVEDDRIFHNLPLGAAVMDLDGKLLKVNRHLCEILQFDRCELLAMDGQTVFKDDTNSLDVNLMEMVQKDSDKAFRVNRKLKTKNGQLIWCQVSIILMHTVDNEAKYYILNIQDVDREINLQDRLLQLNNELLEAQQIGRFGHWSYNFDAHRVYLSVQAAEILQMSTEFQKEEAIKSLFDEAPLADLVQAVQGLTIGGGRLNAIYPLRVVQNVIKYVNIEAEMLMDPLTRSVILKGTIKDVSQIMKLQMEREGFQKNIVNWAFQLSHDLRKPIGSIMGLSELMKHDVLNQKEWEQLKLYLQKAAVELDMQTRELSEQFRHMQELLDDSSQGQAPKYNAEFSGPANVKLSSKS
jgi:PAS domain S-box-containing protein